MADSKKPTSSRALLTTLTDSPALPALVAKLEPRALGRLVAEVGLEDSAALVEHASATQVAYLVEESVWVSVKPGDPESLSVPELLRWFDLWIDIGGGFVAEKLFDLGEDFCALCFSKLIVVAGLNLGPERQDEFSRVIGSYLVRSRFEDEWDSVQAALSALWDKQPNFLETLFARLSFQHSILGFADEDDMESILEADLSHARETSKEQQGFVAATTAGALLSSVARAELEALANEQVYDPDTEQYFLRRARANAQEQMLAAADPVDVGGRSAQAEPKNSDDDSSEQREAELDELQKELERFEILHDRGVELLAGPASSAQARDPTFAIRAGLSALQHDVERFEARTNELVYLSNLVMAGLTATLSEVAAANLVLATCNLGGSYLLWAQAREAQESEANPFAEMLFEEPGLVRLFRIGWNLLARLPVQAANRLTRTFALPEVRQRLAAKPWVAEEVAELMRGFTEMVRRGEYESAQDTLEVLAIALEPEAVPVLIQLIDAVPRFAQVLEPAQGEAQFVSNKGRYISSMADLAVLERYLSSLPNLVGL